MGKVIWNVHLAGIFFVLSAAVGLFAQSLPARDGKQPMNVFQDDPSSDSYLLWWRPSKVVFDEPKAAAIYKQVGTIAQDKISTIDLDTTFGNKEKSAFLFPILACYEEKGAKLLSRFLGKYANGKDWDNDWLIIIASLGRIKHPAAKEILEKELKRLSMEYDFSKPKKIAGTKIELPQRDARFPVIDALISWEARNGSLTANQLDNFSKINPDYRWIIWTVGLEWAQKCMPESDLIKIANDGLATLDEQDLLNRIDMRSIAKDSLTIVDEQAIASDELRAIDGFFNSRSDRWPMLRKILLNKEKRSIRLSEYLISAYCSALITQAILTSGNYEIDEQVIKFITESHIKKYRLFDMNCLVLLACKPSRPNKEWEQFLKNHAANLNPIDESMGKGTIKYIYEKKPQFYKDGFDKPKECNDDIKKPGVYIRGFTAL